MRSKDRFMDEYKNYESLIEKYVGKNIDTILKEQYSFIRYPFIDPGSVYKGNVWDWDSYWSVYALFDYMNRKDDPCLSKRVIEHAKGNVLNFLDHQLEDGYIPMMIEVRSEKEQEPYLNQKHKEGVLMNMHKPFLCQQIVLISEYIEDYEWIQFAQNQLELYFDCYNKNYFKDRSGLYVWCDDIMIGMDNDPASFGRPKFSTANIFLNSFMVMELDSMVKILTHMGNKQDSVKYLEQKNALIRSILEECWDPRDQFFYSVDVDIKTRKYDWFHQGLGAFWKTIPIRIRTWSGFLPMYAGFASAEQAEAMRKSYLDKSLFPSPYGVTTLAKNEKMFDLSATNNPSNWLGPIWVVANYIVFRAMMNYGYRREAEEICRNTLMLLGADLDESGTLHEYYDPFSGHPIMNGGFLNWNILSLNMCRELKETEKTENVKDYRSQM